MPTPRSTSAGTRSRRSAEAETGSPALHDTAVADLQSMRPETLARIESAVTELFCKQDFYAVSLLDVARSANVSLQTIYKYFGSKESLVYSMLDLALSRLGARMIDHLQGIDDTRERLRKTFWVMLDYADRHPDVIRLLGNAIPATRHRDIRIFENPVLIGAFIGVLKEGQQRGVFDDGVSSKILLDVLLGILLRVVQMHLLRGDPKPLIDQFDELFAIVWRALSKPAPQPEQAHTPPSSR
jgi:AcrR family transcriptional regulator